MNTRQLRHPLLALLGVGAGFALLASACGGGDDSAGLETEEYELKEVNDSGYAGDVRVTSPGGNRSVVTIALGQDDEVQGDFPAVIQEGTCDGLSGNTTFDLGQLESGFLTHTVSASIDDLTGSDHALVVFQSGDRQLFVACADL